MYKLKNNKLTNIVGAVSCLGLLALAFLTITPPVVDGASASDTVTSGTAAQLAVVANPVISIALSKPNINMNFTPTRTGEFQSQSTVLSVSTNNTSGYSLLMSSSDASLSNGAGNSIVSITGNNVDASSTSFSNNAWGYQLAGDTGYSAIPVAAKQIKTVATGDVTAGNNQDFTISFGTKVDTTLPAGTYTGEVVLSAVANPIKITNLAQLTFMQEMESSICETTPEGTTKQLIDKRDNKSYWVSKMKDGNCWMVQNLALDLDPAKPLTPADSDVSSNWTPGNKTETEVPAMVADGGPANDTRSWDLGDYVLLDPTSGTICKDTSGVKPDSVSDDGLNSVWSGGSLDDCDRLQKWDSTQDGHYLIGNYYQWNAAAAGSGATAVVNSSAASSICPKGWQLPLSGIINNTTSGSFYSLLERYGLQITAENEQYNVATNPLYYPRSGLINLTTGSLRNVGRVGTFWSSMVTDSGSDAYYLDINGDNIGPSYTLDRYLGFSVRCLAR